jgi:glyoxylase-like metal-dependent hydrolase (beta-lactamase superfamily II)/rhodanese-related sulfurtransferase
MKIDQIYTGCLAQGTYYIESKGEVAIIDPLREVQSYIDRAERDGAKIKYIFETHFHADFVSGHVTLSEQSGAPIIYGPQADPTFEAIIAEDGQFFQLGDVTITALHTPGHTMESTTYLLRDEQGKDHAIFSGDTLFLGDVGRPDLAQKSAHMTKEDLAGILYDSLRNKIMPLADDVIVYPAHGAGSACGKNMMTETVDTLGNQKKMNYALRADMTKEEFIAEVTDGLQPPPAYFPMNVKLNKEGYENFEVVRRQARHALTPDAFELAANAIDAVVLDVRDHQKFIQGFVPRSISIALSGTFAPWVGSLIKDVTTPILLVAEEDDLDEAILRLSRVGFDHTIGYLEGGIEAWKAAGKEMDSITSISAKKLAKRYAANDQIPIFDVRKFTEYDAEHIKGASITPLSKLNDHLAKIPKDETFYIHCRTGYRSVIAASILKAKGFHNLVDIKGGIVDMLEAGLPASTFVCPSTIQ